MVSEKCFNRLSTECLSDILFSGHKKIVNFLIENGADFNVANIQNETALIFAVKSGNLNVAY